MLWVSRCDNGQSVDVPSELLENESWSKTVAETDGESRLDNGWTLLIDIEILGRCCEWVPAYCIFWGGTGQL